MEKLLKERRTSSLGEVLDKYRDSVIESFLLGKTIKEFGFDPPQIKIGVGDDIGFIGNIGLNVNGTYGSFGGKR